MIRSIATTLVVLVFAGPAGAGIEDEPPVVGPVLTERAGGILTAPSFAELALQEEIYTTGGTHPSVYVRGAVSIVFPFDVNVERDSGSSDDLELNSKIGIGFNTGIGLRLGPGPNPSDPGIGYRFEAEFAQRFYDTDSVIDIDGNTVEDIDGNIEVTTIMGNFLIDMTNQSYRGYLGFGVGFAMIDAEINGETDDDTSFALQIPIGVEMRVVDNVWIDFGTRWMYIPGLDIDTDITEFNVLTVDAYIGLLVEF